MAGITILIQKGRWTMDQAESRRRFMQFLAASPLFASGGAFAQGLLPKERPGDPMMWAPPEPGNVTKSPKEAITVFGFEPVMRQNVPPAHFGYMASGIENDVTVRAD